MWSTWVCTPWNSRKVLRDGKERRRSQQFLKVDSGNFDEKVLTEARIVLFFSFAKPDFQTEIARHFKDNLPQADLCVNANDQSLKLNAPLCYAWSVRYCVLMKLCVLQPINLSVKFRNIMRYNDLFENIRFESLLVAQHFTRHISLNLHNSINEVLKYWLKVIRDNI